MATTASQPPEAASSKGAFQRRLAWIFVLQLAGVAVCVLAAAFDAAPLPAMLALIAAISALAWLAARREWRQVSELARIVHHWDERRPDPEQLPAASPSQHTDADIATLTGSLRGLARRVLDYNRRERDFTREASHELRSPLTVIKMSVEMLADEEAMSEFGMRSVQRIRRATHEMEALVEALLILARKSGPADAQDEFVVNDVLRQEIAGMRSMLEGHPVELVLEEPARFALQGSSRVFSVLCWQLIRNACQQVEQGRIVITVDPDAIAVVNRVDASPGRVNRHGFDLAIARRISERFAWPLELQESVEGEHVARIRFPRPLPV
ncbi:sensor histidine kinase [Frateuria defendens]|uniref:sensor histidine kinase n=1 Tax=Frateuria defendens TaxID=2219559 RepID=UPI00066FD68F|nr:HAMP domain-containing sensor histidine kinase [Frateuria defendens]